MSLYFYDGTRGATFIFIFSSKWTSALKGLVEKRLGMFTCQRLECSFDVQAVVVRSLDDRKTELYWIEPRRVWGCEQGHQTHLLGRCLDACGFMEADVVHQHNGSAWQTEWHHKVCKGRRVKRTMLDGQRLDAVCWNTTNCRCCDEALRVFLDVELLAYLCIAPGVDAVSSKRRFVDRNK